MVGRKGWRDAPPRNVAAAIFVAVFLTAGAAALVVNHGLRRAHAAVDRVDHTREVLHHIGVVVENLALFEAAEQGWVYSRSPAFVEPREQALHALGISTRALAALTGDSPGQHARAEQLLQAVQSRSLSPTPSGPPAIQLARQMQQAELGLLAARQAEETEREHEVLLEVLALVGVAGVLLALAYAAAARNVVRREQLEQRLTDLVAHLPVTVYEMERGPQGRKVTFVSQPSLQVRGVAAADVMEDGDILLRSVLEEDRERLTATAARAQEGSGDFDCTYRVRMPGGAIRWVRSRATIHPLPGGRSRWIGYWSDVTAQKEMEMEVETVNRELHAFSYSVSHDLRAPLAAIDGFSDALQEELPPDSARARHYARRIQAGAKQMGELIEGLLQLATLTQSDLKMEPVDLSALARRAVADLAEQDPQREVRVDIAAGLEAQGDRRLLFQVLVNLFGNAWKFTALEAGAHIEFKAHDRRDGMHVFSVADNGVGFDMAHARRLFEPFQRMHGPAEFPGMGIGLATVKRIVSRHGGELWADSAPGRGTTICFTLPARPAA